MDNKALKIAWEAHKFQKRKGTEVPYIIHPIEVAVILIENGASEDLITAGLLHDTLEDTDISLLYIVENFGEYVGELVKAVSEPEKVGSKIKMTDIEKESTWKKRKTHTIEFLKGAPRDVKLLACADKLSNIRSMNKEFKNAGNSIWGRFNASCEEQRWYFTSLLKSLEDICEYPMYREFYELVNKLFFCSEVENFIEIVEKGLSFKE